MDRIFHRNLGVDPVHLLQHGICGWLGEWSLTIKIGISATVPTYEKYIQWERLPPVRIPHRKQIAIQINSANPASQVPRPGVCLADQ